MQQPVTSDLASAAVRVLEVAKKRNLTIVTAESCTAGMLSSILFEAPGAAEHLRVRDLHQREQDQIPGRFGIGKGAVCAEVAIAMAEGALKRSPAGRSQSQ
jgi:nicotinamide-nucleotide amidase